MWIMGSAGRAARVASLTLLLLIAGCGGGGLPSLPTGPSDLMRGLSIYEHANYLGESALVDTSQSDLRDFNGPCEHTESDDGYTTTNYDWDDCISSLRIAPGWRAVIYRDNDYKGQSLQVTGDVPNLQLVTGSCPHDGLNDCVTSIRLFAP